MRTRLCGAVAGVCLLAGCSVSVPKETATLSTTVGQQIAALEASHEAWVRAYYDLSRDRVSDFIIQRWTPAFMENFVVDAQVLAKVTAPGADAARILTDFAQAAQERILQRRAALMAPIDQQEAEALRRLREVYAQLNQMQGTVTAFIETAHEVDAAQDKVAERFGLLEKKNELVRKALKTSDQISAILDGSADPKDVLSKLEALLKPGAEGE